jgi:hypothetical protein
MCTGMHAATLYYPDKKMLLSGRCVYSAGKCPMSKPGPVPHCAKGLTQDKCPPGAHEAMYCHCPPPPKASGGIVHRSRDAPKWGQCALGGQVSCVHLLTRLPTLASIGRRSHAHQVHI